MKHDSDDDSLRQSVLTAIHRYRLVFIQLGAAHGQQMKGDLCSLGDRSYRASKYLHEHVDATGLIVIHGLEEFAIAASTDMGRMRARVLEDMDRGNNYLLISTAPKLSFDYVPGSSLLLDARTVYLPIGGFGSGSDDSSGVWAACNDGTTVAEITAIVLAELGLDIVASLDRAIFESFLPRDRMPERLTEREAEALVGAGLLRLAAGKYEWAIKNRFSEFTDAVSEALSGAVVAQAELALVFTELWALERALRRAVRSGCKRQMGASWKTASLHGDLADKVLERARSDLYAGAKSLREIRDPLEWLSLGELLEVRKMSGIGDLGVEPVVWEKFAREVSPVRNRLSHMRLLMADDLSLVQGWRVIIERKLIV